MKKTILISAILLLAGLAAAAAVDPIEAVNDKVTVPLSKPGQPARIETSILFGSIKVVGYDGKDIIVEAKPREKSLTPNSFLSGLKPSTDVLAPPAPPAPAIARFWEQDQEQADEKAKKARAAGMRQIPLESSGLTVEEQNNVVTIQIDSFRRGYDVVITAPANSSLVLGGANLSSIQVENISGEIETQAAGGSVKLLNVSGPVTVNATNGDIEVVFNRFAPDKPMSFATFNGDIDVTLPAEVKANLRIKSNMGDLFSDFDVNLKSAPIEPEKITSRDGSKFKVTLERVVTGTINGGGPELKFQNWNGNIYIRKKK